MVQTLMRHYSLVCEDHLAEQVARLAQEYGLTEEEVLRQLISAGLSSLD
ncbi:MULTISPECIES: CopG family transcriptional regulator [unclassified Haladaptatus]